MQIFGCAGLLRIAAPLLLGHTIALLCLGQTPPAVWTQHNDNARTGANLAERVLRPDNVKPSTFGKLFTYQLDDETYSQPLYIPGIVAATDGQSHNVVFVTTVNNSVYAWDADTSKANGGRPLWCVSLTPGGACGTHQPLTAAIRPPQADDLGALGACRGDDPNPIKNYHDFAGNMGIVGTPVIDQDRGALFVVARTIENGQYRQRLYALDIHSGRNLHDPRLIEFTESSFSALYNNQRAALALVNGIIYIAWSSHCDFGPYHGWIAGYRASDLRQVASWNDTPANGAQGGIWQGGQGLAADSPGDGSPPHLYFSTGNGTSDGAQNFAESAVNLATSADGTIRSVASFFTPMNAGTLNFQDLDLGSSGLTLLPGSSLLAGGGKQGMVYLMDRANMGGFQTMFDNVLQRFQATFPQHGCTTGHIHGGPVFFNDGGHQYMYLWGENDSMRVFELLPASPGMPAHFNSSPVAQSSMRVPEAQCGMPGGFLSISANGKDDGIVWALAPYDGDANQHVVSGILYSFRASSFGKGHAKLCPLWTSHKNRTRDDVGLYAKFTYPTIANGRVYVASWGASPKDPANPDTNSGRLLVYGLLNPNGKGRTK